MATKTCPYCGGVGHKDETKTELEYAYIPLLGFPMPRTRTVDVSCSYCNGTGQVEDNGQ